MVTLSQQHCRQTLCNADDGGSQGCVVSEEEQAIDAGQKERQIGNDVKKVGRTEKATIIRKFIIHLRWGMRPYRPHAIINIEHTPAIWDRWKEQAAFENDPTLYFIFL